MHLPEKNKYIAEDTSFKPIPAENSKYPTRIVDETHGELFHRRDDIFKQPLAYVKFYLVSPATMRDVKSSVCLDLFASCISQIMVEETYPADLAQLGFLLSSAERGLLIKLSGLNDKLNLLLETILNNVLKLVRDVRMTAIQDVYFKVTDKHDIIGDVKKDDVVEFMKAFMSGAFLQGSVQGNLTAEESEDLFDMIRKKLNYQDIKREEFPEMRCKILPKGMS